MSWRVLDEAERLHDGSSDEHVELSTLRGVALLDTGEGRQALDELHRAIDADPDATHGSFPILLTHTGRAHLLAGDHASARRCLEGARHVVSDSSLGGRDRRAVGDARALTIAEGDLDGAGRLLDDAYESACQIGDPCWETWATHGLAKLAATTGLSGEAFQRVHRGSRAEQRSGNEAATSGRGCGRSSMPHDTPRPWKTPEPLPGTMRPS